MAPVNHFLTVELLSIVLVPVPNLSLKGKDVPVDAYMVQLPLPHLEHVGDGRRRPRYAGAGGATEAP